MIKRAEPIINLRYPLVAALCVLIGILLADLCCMCGYGLIIIIFSVCFLAVLLLCFKGKIHLPVKASAVVALLFLILGFAISWSVISKNLICPNYFDSADLTGEVCEVNRYDDDVYHLVLKDVNFGGNKVRGNVVFETNITAANGEEIISGDVIKFFASLQKHSYYDGKTFNRDVLTGPYNYVAQASGDDFEIEILFNRYNFFNSVNRAISTFLRSGMDNRGFPLALAILIGDTSELPTAKINNYRFAGIAHMFAVSGLHIGLFAVVLGFIADKLKFNRLMKFIFTMPVLFIYCGVCSFRSSVVRAFLMCATKFINDGLGIKNDALNSCAIAAVLILLIAPFSLYTVGFCLSFGAVIGVLVFSNMLKRSIGRLRNTKAEKLVEPFSVALSAQLGVLPICTDKFGYMSVISVFVNIVIIPFASLVYQILLFMCIPGIVEYLIFGSAQICLFLPNALLGFIDIVVNVVPFDAFLVKGLNFGYAVVPYAVGLLCISDLVNISGTRKKVLGGVCLAVAALLMFI